MNSGGLLASATHLIAGRRAVRAFQPRPVSEEVIAAVIELARYAPSGSNTQPWKVYAVTGSKQTAIINRLRAAFDDPDAAGRHLEEYDYYPREWHPPYLERRRKVGWDLYSLLGISKDDKRRMHAQHRRNVEFFDAPVTLFFTIDRIMGKGSWLDYGMFIQNVMLAARAHGLASCPQAAVNPFHAILREELGWPDAEMLVCSMSMGYEDHDALIGQLKTERAPVESILQFFD